MVAVLANKVRYSESYVRSFDLRERMTGVPNWLYLTGSLRQLRPVWLDYGIIVLQPPGGGMAVHNDIGFVIDRSGHVRASLSDDPGQGTQSSRSSFAVLFSQLAERYLTPR